MSEENTRPKKIDDAGLKREEKIAKMTAKKRANESLRVVKANKDRHVGLTTFEGSRLSIGSRSITGSPRRSSVEGIENEESLEFSKLFRESKELSDSFVEKRHQNSFGSQRLEKACCKNYRHGRLGR